MRLALVELLLDVLAYRHQRPVLRIGVVGQLFREIPRRRAHGLESFPQLGMGTERLDLRQLLEGDRAAGPDRVAQQVRQVTVALVAVHAQDDVAPDAVVLDYSLYGMISHMPATLIFEDKTTFPDGSILQIRIWRLPAADAERPHGLKYSLFYGRPGERIIGYDNERGKGDHRHYRDTEEPYVFVSPEQLRDDFLADVRKERQL